MSFRGSFVTEFIYCEKCLEAAKKILLADSSKYFSGHQVDTYPIIAGGICDGTFDRQLSTFEDDFKEKLAEAICHPVTIVFLPEAEDVVTVVVTPKN